MTRHLVIFARAPRLGAVKRRLAAGIGALAALRFHRLMAGQTLRRLAGDPRWACRVALTPDAAPWPRDWPRAARVAQGRGDIGRRMAAAFRALPPGPAVLVGCDIPDLSARHVAAAFAALGRADIVFGPAADGGYWLVGLSGRRPRPDPFRGVRWSTAHALADTLRNCAGRRVALLGMLADVDDAAAHRRWRALRRGIPG